MKRRRLIWFVGLILAAGVGIGIWISLQSPWFSSPTEVRRSPIDRTLHQPIQRWDEHRTYVGKPDESFLSARLSSEKENTWLVKGAFGQLNGDLSPEESEFANFHGVPSPPGLSFLEAIDSAVDFGDGRHLQLLGFAIAQPGQDPEFFEPNAAALSQNDLAEAGVPLDWLNWKPERFFNGPFLRLYFRQAGHKGFFRLGAHAFDHRTNALIGKFESLLPRLVSEHGDFIAFDLILKTWHDTPVEIAFAVPSGSPRELKLGSPPSSVSSRESDGVFDYQILATGDGQVVRTKEQFAIVNGRETAEFQFDPSLPGHFFITAYRSGTPNRNGFDTTRFALRVQKPDGRFHDVWAVAMQKVGAYARNLPEGAWNPDEDELVLRVFPEHTWLWFQLPALPALSKVENLFDVEMREISPITTERADPGKNSLYIIGNATEMEIDLSKIPRRRMTLRPFQPQARTTPRQLLDSFLEENPQLQAEVDPKQNVIRISVRQPWGERVKVWWRENAPFR